MLPLALWSITLAVAPQGADEVTAERIRAAARVHGLDGRLGIVPADRKCPYCSKSLSRLVLAERDSIEGPNRDVALVCAEDGIGYLVGEGLMHDGEAGPFALPRSDAEARGGLEPFGTLAIEPCRTMETGWNVVTRSPDLRYAAGGGHEPVLRVWSTRQLVEDASPLGPTAFAFSPRSEAFAAAHSGGNVLVWSLPSGRRRELRLSGFVNVAALAFDPDAERLALSWHESDRHLLVIRRLRDGAETARLDAEGLGGITRMVWSPDGRRLAAGDRDGHLRVWDVSRSRVATDHAAGEPIWDLAWGGAGAHVALATGRGPWRARVVELASGRAWILSAEPVGPYGEPVMPSIAIDARGERFAWLLPDGTIAFGGVREGEIRTHFGARGQQRIELDGADGFRTDTDRGRRMRWDPARGLSTVRIRRVRT